MTDIIIINETIQLESMSRLSCSSEQELILTQQSNVNKKYIHRKCKTYVTSMTTHVCPPNIIASTYKWNSFMFSMFISLRLISSSFFNTPISVHKWYNDIPIFLMANHYIYKRIHWNNKRETFGSQIRPEFKQDVMMLLFLSILVVYSVIHMSFNKFYLTYDKIRTMNSGELSAFISICIYVVSTQACSNYYIGIRQHFYKYLLILLYIFSGTFVYSIVQTTPDNNYHLHHWILGIFLLFLTEFPQPYHTVLQYLHYAIYLHGIAVYSYDALTE